MNLPAAAARQANRVAAAAPGGPAAPAAPANQAAPAAAQRAAQAQAHQLHHAACKSYVCGVIIDIEVSMFMGVMYVCMCVSRHANCLHFLINLLYAKYSYIANIGNISPCLKMPDKGY